MNEPVATARPQIDVDEFERFLRRTATPQPGTADDPLAELARMVGNVRDPYDEVFLRGGSSSAQPAARPNVDFSVIEAGLRGTFPAHSAPAHQDSYAPDYAGGDGQGAYGEPSAAYEGHEPQYSAAQQWVPPADGRVSREPRSRKPVYAVAAVILLGITGIGIAFAYKGGNSGPREVAMIKAAPGPSKILPPADDSANTAREGGAIEDSAAPAPVKTVTHEEQPVDLAQSVQDAPRTDAANNGIQPIYSFGMSSPAGGQPNSAPPAGAGPSGVASDIQPVRVKTRSYRPDGTPIQDDHIPAAAIDDAAGQPSTTVKPASPAAVAKASTPRTAATTKTTTRAAPTAKPLTAAKPIVVADRDPGAPTDLSPSAIHARPPRAPAPIETASASPAAEAEHTGGFAVQLAAPGSDAEAKQTAARLGAKFSSELAGRHLGTYKAVINGKTVFRIRTPSLSREEAVGLCEKLKANGGSCFIAKT